MATKQIINKTNYRTKNDSEQITPIMIIQLQFKLSASLSFLFILTSVKCSLSVCVKQAKKNQNKTKKISLAKLNQHTNSGYCFFFSFFEISP